MQEERLLNIELDGAHRRYSVNYNALKTIAQRHLGHVPKRDTFRRMSVPFHTFTEPSTSSPLPQEAPHMSA